MQAIIKKRLSMLKKRFKKDGLDAMILTLKEDVRWISGFEGDDSWVLVPSRGKAWLITDSRYTEQAENECVDTYIFERKGVFGEAVGEILKKFKDIKKVGMDVHTSIGTFDAVKKKIGKYSLSMGVNHSIVLRSIKEDIAVKKIQKAIRLNIKALDITLKEVCVGISESELAGLLELNMRRLGGKPAFESIVGFGENGSLPHYVPGKRKLRKNDSILIDWGILYDGHVSDMTRCFTVGNVSKEYRAAYETVQRAQAAAIEKIAAGVECRVADEACRSVIEASEFPVYGHGTGHGVGFQVHESPNMSRVSKDKFSVGNIVTVEPGIYVPGKFGIRIEDDILVSKDGCKILSRGKKSPELVKLF